MRITLVGGPTALLEIEQLRLLTDPTFDPAGSEMTYGPVTLRKTAGPAVALTDLGRIDAVLLSHDQHFDNLDRSGRESLAKAQTVITTQSGATRLAGKTKGLAPWDSTVLGSQDEMPLVRVTATPARHGPAGIEPVTGEVIGFVLQTLRNSSTAVYVTGDTVWYEGVAEVAKRFEIGTIVLFAGAAQLKARGPSRLTMNSEDAIATAHAFPKARIVPIHNHGWEHFTENQLDLVHAFERCGLQDRLCTLEPGDSILIH
jgi:L-ascorbate metabolism protein UlaG (beta-lactamase superfamily)